LVQYHDRTPGVGTSDLAVLELKKGEFRLSDSDAIPGFVTIDSASEQHVFSWGFPTDVSNTLDQSVPANYKVTGISHADWLYIESRELQGNEIRAGFSGSPVMEESSSRLVGIICEADDQRRTATVIPTKQISLIVDLVITEEKEQEDSLALPSSPTLHQLTRPGLRLIPEVICPRLHYFLSTRNILRDPPDRAVLQELIDHNRAIWINDLKDKTYLPPPAKELDHSGVQLQRAGGTFLLPIQQLIKEIAGLSAGGDSSSAQISALSKRSRTVGNLVHKLMRSTEPIIVLGEPGAGKSLTLKQTALELAKINRRKVFPQLCIFIPLGRWVPVKSPDIEDVEKLVLKNIPENVRPVTQDLIQQRRLIIIFDGLDEMSREKYIEHTEALSKFADKYQDRVRTLFSCRIADFSPAFRHQRLVLMPFDHRHVRLYLQRQFGDTRISLSGELVTASQLSKRLLNANLPIQPQNPFSLWLLCLYIRENGVWPESRAELLQFSFTYQFKLKADEAIGSGDAFPSREEMFMNWGRLAFEITSLNKGTDVPMHMIRGLFGNQAGTILTTARNCGVLLQSTGQEIVQWRFVHHRAQEFYTAYYLVHSTVSIDWNAYLDIPRWQETLILISQMPAGAIPINDLVRSLESSTENFLIADDTDKRNRMIRESVIAERVEFCSRIAKVSPDNKDYAEFFSKLQKLVLLLGDKGNPITQVKMLNVIQILHYPDLYVVVSNLRNSRVNWVRENAEAVAASLAGKSNAGDLPEDTLTVYSSGSILSSLPRRLRLAKRIQSRKFFLMSCLAAMIFLVQTLAMAGIFPLAAALSNEKIESQITSDYVSSSKKEQNFSATVTAENIRLIHSAYWRWQPLMVAAVTLLILVGALFLAPWDVWMYTIGGGGVAFILSVLILALWVYSPLATFKTLIGYVVITVAVLISLYRIYIGIVALFALIIQTVFIAVLSVVIWAWTGEWKYLFKSHRIAWEQSKLDEALGFKKNRSNSVLLWAIGGAAFALLEKVFSKDFFTRLILKLPLVGPTTDAIVTLGLLASVAYIIYNLCVARVGSKRQRLWSALKKSWYPIFITAAYYALQLLGIGIEALVTFLVNLLPNISATAFIKYLIYFIVIAILLGGIFLIYTLVRKFVRMPVRLPTNQHEFVQAMTGGSPYKQAYILNSVTPVTLSIDQDTFYHLLLDLDSLIQDEPAKSKYLSKIAEMQELIRQSRIG
jgi:hypothetical protein